MKGDFFVYGLRCIDLTVGVLGDFCPKRLLLLIDCLSLGNILLKEWKKGSHHLFQIIEI